MCTRAKLSPQPLKSRATLKPEVGSQKSVKSKDKGERQGQNLRTVDSHRAHRDHREGRKSSGGGARRHEIRSQKGFPVLGFGVLPAAAG